MKILISIIVFLSVFVSYPLYAQSALKNKSKRASLVEVKKVKIFNIAEKTNTIGRSVAINPTIISSKINQEILKIHFKIGDNVKKNDLLFTLNSKDIVRDIKQISAELKYEEQTLNFLDKQSTLRKSKLSNAKNLRKKNIITQDNLDNVNITLLQNQQQIAKAKYNIKRLKILLEKNKEDLSLSKIKSPVNGNIISIDAKIGAMTTRGQVLASIVGNGSNEIETDLRSDLASIVKIGSNVEIIHNNSIFSGKVRGIVNLENIRTGTRKLRISLDEILPKNLNTLGTRFSLYISVGESIPRLLIPKDALIPMGSKKIVYVFDNGLAKQKTIEVGISVGNKIEILNGLVEGELVVIKGNENLRPNEEIKIISKKKVS